MASEEKSKIVKDTPSKVLLVHYLIWGQIFFNNGISMFMERIFTFLSIGHKVDGIINWETSPQRDLLNKPWRFSLSYQIAKDEWFYPQKLLIAAAKLLNHGSQITELRQPNYWIMAATLLKTTTTFWPPTKPGQGERTSWRTAWGVRATVGSVKWRQVCPAYPRT